MLTLSPQTSNVPLKSRAAIPSRSEQILHDLPQPMLVVRPDRRLMFANASAEAMLSNGYGRDRDAHLMSIGQLDAPVIEGVLRRALDGRGAKVGLWFPELRTGWLSVSRVPPGITSSTDWPFDSLLLLIHLDEPKLSQPARIDGLCQQCGLTCTERYVLLLLADGMAAQDIAQHLAVQISTIRSHIRSLLGKTHAPSLMQLVRQVGSTEPLGTCV